MITNSNFWFWFGGLWLAIGVLFVGVGGGIGLQRSRLEARFEDEGSRTQGIVLTKQRSRPNDGPERYRVTFRFSDARGETIRGAARVERDACDSLVERGPIDVVFLPARPEAHRVTGQDDGGAVLAFVFPLTGGVLTVVGAFVLGNALRTRRLARALGRSGAVAVGSVTDVGPGRVRINGVPQWVLRYRFQDASGRAHEGRCSLSPEEAASWQPGARARVRYDARNPRAHLWTGERA